MCVHMRAVMWLCAICLTMLVNGFSGLFRARFHSDRETTILTVRINQYSFQMDVCTPGDERTS